MKKTRREFARFVVVGGIAAIVNIASRYAINDWTPYEYAVILAYIVGMLTAFILNKAFVFTAASRDETHAQLLRFTLVNIVAAAQVWLISVGLAEYLFPMLGFAFHPYEVAHIIGVVFPIFTSFFGHKYFSFRTIKS